jgi:proteasome lid subunit RPN8/RPN11
MGNRRENVVDLNTMFNINESDWYEIISWAKLSHDEDKNEISGLATALPNDKGIYTIRDIEILKQENSASNTELDGDEVTKYKMKYGMKYQNPDMKFVWWHSHHTMDAFWSGTDLKEINAWKNTSFSLALVVNLKEEYKFRVSLWKAGNLDLEQHFDIPLNIIRSTGVKITKGMKKKYKELCEDDSPHVFVGGNYNVRQGTIWNTHIDTTKIEQYNQVLKKIGSVNDSFMQNELSFKDWKKELKEVQSKLNEFKIKDYKVIIPEGNKQEVISELMHTMPESYLEFKDNQVELNYQTSDYRQNGWYY